MRLLSSYSTLYSVQMRIIVCVFLLFFFFFNSYICRCVLLFVLCVPFLIHFCAYIAMHWLDFSFSVVICFIHRQNVQTFLLVVYRHKTFCSHSLTLFTSLSPESFWNIYIVGCVAIEKRRWSPTSISHIVEIVSFRSILLFAGLHEIRRIDFVALNIFDYVM